MDGGQSHAAGLEQEDEGAQGPRRVDRAEYEEHDVLAEGVGHGQVHFVGDERAERSDDGHYGHGFGLDVGREHLAQQCTGHDTRAHRVGQREQDNACERRPAAAFTAVDVQMGGVRSRHGGHAQVRDDQQWPAAAPVDQRARHHGERQPDARKRGGHVIRVDRPVGRQRGGQIGDHATDAAGALRETRAHHQQKRHAIAVVGEQLVVRTGFGHVFLHALHHLVELFVLFGGRQTWSVPLERAPRLFRPSLGQQIDRRVGYAADGHEEYETGGQRQPVHDVVRYYRSGRHGH